MNRHIITAAVLTILSGAAVAGGTADAPATETLAMVATLKVVPLQVAAHPEVVDRTVDSSAAERLLERKVQLMSEQLDSAINDQIKPQLQRDF